MADTTFIDQQSVVYASWLNDVNDAVYSGIGDGSVAGTTPALVRVNIRAYTGEGAAVASASTCEIWATEGDSRHITGTTAITSFGTSNYVGRWMKLIFDDAVLLTQGANLNLNNGGSNVTTAAGDLVLVYADTVTQFDVYVIKASGQPNSVLGALQALVIVCSDEVTALTAGTAKVTFRMPFAMTLRAGIAGVRGSLTTAQPGGSLLTIDVNEAGASILSTKLTFDNTETTTTTAATPVVVSDTALADDAQMTVDFDVVGTSGAAGLKITLIGTVA